MPEDHFVMARHGGFVEIETGGFEGSNQVYRPADWPYRRGDTRGDAER
ncbi:hypothetical protein [Phytoactinopolyspora halophila]|nr:hypothetical protein [Phytoactinopolyspora halophila]